MGLIFIQIKTGNMKQKCCLITKGAEFRLDEKNNILNNLKEKLTKEKQYSKYGQNNPRKTKKNEMLLLIRII